MYPYDATCEGELSLRIGDVVTIISKKTGSDAWWEGEGPLGKVRIPNWKSGWFSFEGPV